MLIIARGILFISVPSRLTKMYPVRSARCSPIAALNALGKITEREAACVSYCALEVRE